MFEIRKETLPQANGAAWEAFDIDGGKAVLTSKGRQLFHEEREVWRDIRKYRKKAAGRLAVQSHPVVREHFASGGNSDVYTLNDRMVIKEANTKGSILYTVERMDRLLSVIEARVPRWIDIPTHYGLLYSRNLDRQYLLMQKIDSGITVEHIVNKESLSEKQQSNIRKEFGSVSEEEMHEVKSRFTTAGKILTSALEDSNYDPQAYLTDWHEGNVLVEKLTTPIAGSPYKMWVIDQ